MAEFLTTPQLYQIFQDLVDHYNDTVGLFLDKFLEFFLYHNHIPPYSQPSYWFYLRITVDARSNQELIYTKIPDSPYFPTQLSPQLYFHQVY